VVGLLIEVLVLSSVTAYLVVLVLQQRSFVYGGSAGASRNYAVSVVPGAGILGSSQTSGGLPSYSISVSGTAQVSYTPNEALLMVSVVTNAGTAQDAIEVNAASAGKVIKSLNSIGVDNSSIQTQGYSLSPNYANSYGGNAPPNITGYTVTNSLLVNVTSGSAPQLGSKAGQVIDTSVAAGANQVSLQFAATSSLLSHLNDLALQGAIASAAGQAHVIASSLGVNITGVVSASEGYSQSYYPSTQYLRENVSGGTAVSTPIVPGTQYSFATVTDVYSKD
jgi:uncharacterized protein YggE